MEMETAIWTAEGSSGADVALKLEKEYEKVRNE